MNIGEKIALLTSKDQKQAYNALKELIACSEHSDQGYQYFDCFVEMMRDANSYVRTRGLRFIAYHSKWDKDKKVDQIIEEYLMHMEDEKPITARQCIKDTPIIARYKPELMDQILMALDHCDKIYDDSMQHLIYQDRQQAIRQIRQYTW